MATRLSTTRSRRPARPARAAHEPRPAAAGDDPWGDPAAELPDDLTAVDPDTDPLGEDLDEGLRVDRDVRILESRR